MAVTDEDAALAAISTLDPLSKEQREACDELSAILSGEGSFVDTHQLFRLYDTLYFRSLLLPCVEVIWSSRLTLCAGICELVKDDQGKYRRIRLKLSEALLKYRPRSDTVNTLLHEAVHAYFFVTTSWHHAREDDGTGHGAGFLLLADAINNHGGYEITVYHTFHDEVDSYRTHVWQCDGPCRSLPPFFGLVKRSMNRPPGKSDTWWKKHEEECGGKYTKIAAPELTQAQVRKLGAKERAGRQKNKISGWVNSPTSLPLATTSGARQRCQPSNKRPASPLDNESTSRSRRVVACPICDVSLSQDLINEHMDECHPL
ncbi:hypothetical protein LTR66_010790 [Elasticomyces elasticus]|nr:hypothetical protein LTR28_008636 [Elasticomyces elasticus]KAK4976617.1 hypothetical protein LTR66_010790 [Elasticomyces elasticus]